MQTLRLTPELLAGVAKVARIGGIDRTVLVTQTSEPMLEVTAPEPYTTNGEFAGDRTLFVLTDGRVARCIADSFELDATRRRGVELLHGNLAVIPNELLHSSPKGADE